MLFDIQMKTGFFETKAYEMLIGKDRIVLSLKECGSDIITIREDDILSVTLKNQKTVEIEIQTREKIYQGNLPEGADFENLFKMLKDNLSSNIICEYGGGKDYA